MDNKALALVAASGALAAASANANSNMHMLEVESGTASDDKHDCRSRIFPMRPFRFCPNILCIYFPDTLKEIQDWTHLSLSLGMVSLIGLVVFNVVQLAVRGMKIFQVEYVFGSREIVTFLLFGTVTPYAWQILQQYDQRLTDKQAEAKRAKEDLSRKYQDLCADMHDTLDKFAEYTGAYAQNIFEGKYRSFGRWAMQVAQTLEQEFGTTVTDQKGKADMLEQFRVMCMNWFRVLQECGINPAERPVILCKKEELDRLGGFVEIAKFVTERCSPPKITVEKRKPTNSSGLWTSHMKGRCENCDTIYKPSEASSMKGKCDKCSKGVMGFKFWLEEIPVWNTKRPGTCENCKQWFSPEQANECDGECPKCKSELIELKPVTQELQQQQQAFKKDATHAKAQAKRFSGGQQQLELNPTGSRTLMGHQHTSGRSCCRCWPTWLECCTGCHCSKVYNVKSKDLYPRTYSCCCTRLKVFSRDHVKLMVGFVFCLVLVGLNTFWILNHYVSEEREAWELEFMRHSAGYICMLVGVACITVSLLILLIRFEDLDTVQQLEAEMRDLIDEKERVENTNKTVQETFGLLQQMNVVWLNRTIPRLDLMNEISYRLCDIDQNTERDQWVRANKAIADLERKIGGIQDWVSDEKLQEGDKKNFEKLIRGVYQESTVQNMITGLARVNNDSLGFLAALEPPKAETPMVNLQTLQSVSDTSTVAGPFTAHRNSDTPMYEP